MYNTFHNKVNFWKSRLIIIGISDSFENCIHSFLYFELSSTQPKPFPSARLFYQVQVEIVRKCLFPQDLYHF